MNLLWLVIAVMPQLKDQNTSITLQLNKERDEKLTTQFIQNRMAYVMIYLKVFSVNLVFQCFLFFFIFLFLGVSCLE